MTTRMIPMMTRAAVHTDGHPSPLVVSAGPDLIGRQAETAAGRREPRAAGGAEDGRHAEDATEVLAGVRGRVIGHRLRRSGADEGAARRRRPPGRGRSPSRRS